MSFAARRPFDRRRVPPFRSVLFVPGSDGKRLEEVARSRADAVVLDLEEPETPMSESVRERAHALCGELLRERAARGVPGAPHLFVRTRAPSTGWLWRDLTKVLAPSLEGILLPKIEGPEDVVAADALLLAAERETGLTPGSILLYPILETAQALRLAYEIAMASPRVAYMGGAISRFGDIHQALGYTWTADGEETHFLRSKVLLDCRAAGIRYPISGMWGGSVDDEAGLRRWATRLRNLGYYGMMLGAEAHVPLVHEIFSPTPEQIAYWSELVRLGDEAERSGRGPVLHGDPDQGEGHEVHLAHIESARLNLEWSRDLGLAAPGPRS
ncbi:MAG: HpcH/HpaI aldolase/citrate lyase family protein [bacterium]